jgi:hypothetical protein
MTDRTGATIGQRPSADRRAAVSVAPGSGRVIKTRFKMLLLSKKLQSMMCGASRSGDYPNSRYVATETEGRLPCAWARTSAGKVR